MAEIVCTPTKMLGTPPSDNRGGPGEYNGANDNGFPTRTPSPNALPEKFIDANVPSK